jgi:hypothetical protein
VSLADAFTEISIKQARAEAAAERWESCLEWLVKVPAPRRPSGLISQALEGAARQAMAEGSFGRAAALLERRLRHGEDRLLRLRLTALRERQPLMSAATWAIIRSQVPACRRTPEPAPLGLDGIWAAGAYHAWSGRGAPWSRLLRAAKDPAEKEDGWETVGMACGYAARWILEFSPIAKVVDCVVAIPARPAKYVERMMALPDELGKALRSFLCLPYLPDGLVSTVDELEM